MSNEVLSEWVKQFLFENSKRRSTSESELYGHLTVTILHSFNDYIANYKYIANRNWITNPWMYSN